MRHSPPPPTWTPREAISVIVSQRGTRRRIAKEQAAWWKEFTRQRTIRRFVDTPYEPPQTPRLRLLAQRALVKVTDRAMPREFYPLNTAGLISALGRPHVPRFSGVCIGTDLHEHHEYHWEPFAPYNLIDPDTRQKSGSNANYLITGETGSGKSAFAKLLIDSIAEQNLHVPLQDQIRCIIMDAAPSTDPAYTGSEFAKLAKVRGWPILHFGHADSLSVDIVGNALPALDVNGSTVFPENGLDAFYGLLGSQLGHSLTNEQQVAVKAALERCAAERNQNQELGLAPTSRDDSAWVGLRRFQHHLANPQGDYFVHTADQLKTIAGPLTFALTNLLQQPIIASLDSPDTLIHHLHHSTEPTVIDLSEYEKNPEALLLATTVLSSVLAQQWQIRGAKQLLHIEEAWVYEPYPAFGDFLVSLSKFARKRSMALGMSIHNLTDPKSKNTNVISSFSRAMAEFYTHIDFRPHSDSVQSHIETRGIDSQYWKPRFAKFRDGQSLWQFGNRVAFEVQVQIPEYLKSLYFTDEALQHTNPRLPAPWERDAGLPSLSAPPPPGNSPG